MEEYDNDIEDYIADYLYDSIKDEAMMISSIEEAREYANSYPIMARFVKHWFDKEKDK